MGIFSSKQNQPPTTTATTSTSTTSLYKTSTIQTNSNSSLNDAKNHIQKNELDVEMASNVVATSSTTTSTTTFAIGDTVMAKWKENDTFYPAEIVSLNRKKNRLKYVVSFYDNVKDTIAEEDVRAVEADEMSSVAKKFADAQNSATTSKVSKKKVTGPKKILKRLKDKAKTKIDKKSVSKKLKKLK